MSYRKLFVLLTVMVVAVITLSMGELQPVRAGGDWFAYLFSSSPQELLRVHLSGKIDVVPVTFRADEHPGGSDMSFSAYGDMLAYCTKSDDSQQTLLALWKLSNNDNTAQQLLMKEIGNPIGCRVSGFDPDSKMIAVGLVNYFPGDPNADTTLPPWSLQIMTPNGAVMYEMNPSTPGFVQTPGWENTTVMPDVVYFDYSTIIFRLIPWGVDGAVNGMPAYQWELGGGISTIERWGAGALDSLKDTGELVWAELDSSLPAAVIEGPMPQVNVVKLADKTGSPPRTIYYTADAVISDVLFIDGGKRLAIKLVMPPDPAAPELGSPAKLIGLDRTGQVTDLETDIFSYSEIDYGPGGYLFFLQSGTELSYTLEYVTPNGKRNLLWQADGQPWEYVWGMGWTAQPDLAPFPDAVIP